MKGFDHHCCWLNNCIGDSNYRVFAVFITAAELTIIFLITLLTLALISMNEGILSKKEEENDNVT